jgi:hypothetical protein
MRHATHPGGPAARCRRTPRHRGAAALLAAAVAIAWGGPVRAQAPLDAAQIERLNQEVAFSLFVLTNSGFTAGGFARYDDPSTSADFTVYSLPLRQRFTTGLLGPVELRLAVNTGQATTNTVQAVAGVPGAVTADRTLLNTWNGRIDVGRPIALTPELEFTPLLGLGYSAWTGKATRRQAGAVPVADSRLDFWTDALLYDVIGILEYRHRWRDLTITPGIAVNYTYIDSFDGRGDTTAQPGVPAQRGPVRIEGSSTLLRAAVRVEGPLGLELVGTALRWQGFVVGAYEPSRLALFPWSVEIGAALGADFGPLGRRTVGIDPGPLFLGASYIVGENLQGVRVNFGFRF